MNKDRNNSWDAFWQDAAKGAIALGIPLAFGVFWVFGGLMLLIVLVAAFLFWVFVLA